MTKKRETAKKENFMALLHSQKFTNFKLTVENCMAGYSIKTCASYFVKISNAN